MKEIRLWIPITAILIALIAMLSCAVVQNVTTPPRMENHTNVGSNDPRQG
jgi:hypothetical protein